MFDLEIVEDNPTLASRPGRRPRNPARRFGLSHACDSGEAALTACLAERPEDPIVVDVHFARKS